MAQESETAFRTRVHRLIFASRLQFEDAVTAVRGLESIRDSATRNNTAAELSGLLLIHDGWFLEALEGHPDAVMHAYGRIVTDTRHNTAKLLASGLVEDRMFEAWTVCARVFGAGDAAILDALDRRGPFDAGRLTDRAALKLLKTIQDIQMRAKLAA